MTLISVGPSYLGSLYAFVFPAVLAIFVMELKASAITFQFSASLEALLLTNGHSIPVLMKYD